jgi:hypothetical protein
VAGETQAQTLRSGSTYLSQNELVITAGLGQNAKADTIEVLWPSGVVDRLTNVAADQYVTVQEGKAMVSAHPYGKPATARTASVSKKGK